MKDFSKDMDQDFVKFRDAVLDLVKSFEKNNLMIKVAIDPESETIKLHGERSGSLERAKDGLEEVLEIAYATAEHHPYWNLLYNGSQILNMVLEKWKSSLTEEEIKEIDWYADEIKNSLSKLLTSHHHE